MKALKNLGVVGVILLILLTFTLWAAFYELDQTVHATGQIVSDKHTQIIQSADGGVLSELLVEEGQVVKAGQVLAVLEKERANAGVEEGMAKVAYLKASLIRARAEASQTEPDFTQIPKRHSEFIQEQRNLYAQRKAALDEEIKSLSESYQLAEEELEINKKLIQTGDVSTLDLLRAKRQVSDLSGRITSIKNKYLQDARQEAAKYQDELSSQTFKLDERKSVLFHTELIAPVDGVVKTLRLNTVGGVLRAGDELMQISPTQVDLILEAKVSPSDVGLLQVGLPASVRIDAFDYTIYGALEGTLNYISSDTILEQSATGQSTANYKVRVNFDKNLVHPKIDINELRPGMTASVDIRTNSRSVLVYLFKPIARAFQGVASQR